MNYRTRLRFQLLRLLKCSHKQADEYCLQGLVEVDGKVERNPFAETEDHQEIKLKSEIIREGKKLLYVLFHKPYLFECTTNRNIENNIYEILPENYQNLFTLGRLDKNSTGLLLLTNDGKVHSDMVGEHSKVDKEYLVTTYHPITLALELAFTQPFKLGNRMTLPAKFECLSDFEFKVTLNEGINRQIRRICAKNGNQVKTLTRIRFGKYLLDDLAVGQCRVVDKFEC